MGGVFCVKGMAAVCVGGYLGRLGSPDGEEGVKYLCTSAGHQVSWVQVPAGRGGARPAPGPLSSLRLGNILLRKKHGGLAEKETLTDVLT